jgi:hypothetical protein
MGNAFSAVSHLLSWDQVQADLPEFDWFSGQDELDQQLARMPGVRTTTQLQTSSNAAGAKNANRHQRAKILQQQQQHTPLQREKAEYRLELSNQRTLVTPVKAVPRSNGGSQRKKRKDSPNKEEDEGVEMETVQSNVGNTGTHPSAQPHSTSDHQLRKRQMSASKKAATLAPSIHTSNAFAMLSPFSQASAARANRNKNGTGVRKPLLSKDCESIAIGFASASTPAAAPQWYNQQSTPQAKPQQQEMKYSSNAKVNASRITKSLSTRSIPTTTPPPPMQMNASNPAIAFDVKKKPAELVNPTVSYANKVAGKKQAVSSSPPGTDWMANLSSTAASTSSFYAVSTSSSGASVMVPIIQPPPPPPSEFMPRSSAIPVIRAPPANVDMMFGLPTPTVQFNNGVVPMDAEPTDCSDNSSGLTTSLAGLTAEVLAEAKQIVARQAAAHAAEKIAAAEKLREEELAKAEMAKQIAAAPVAPPMAPPMVPCAPPMAPALTRSASLPAQPQSTANSKLKKFHWTALPAHAVEENTLWAELDSSATPLAVPEIDADDMERMFSTAAPAKKLDEEEDDADHTADARMTDAEEGMVTPIKRQKSLKAKPAVTIIDAKRSYNVSIALTRFLANGPNGKRTQEDVKSAIISLDGSILDEDSLAILSNIVPTDEEAKAVSSWVASNPQKVGELAVVESWFHILSVIPSVHARIAHLQVCASFSSSLTRVEDWLGVIEQSCKEIRSSMALKSMLVIVLRLGNFLNTSSAAGSRAGGRIASAGGFKLSSLAKLRFTKTADGTSTLLHYLVSFIQKECREVLSWLSELAHVPEAARIESATVAQEVKQLRDGMKSIDAELARCARVTTRAKAASAPDQVVEDATRNLKEYLTTFTGDAAPRLDALLKRHKSCIDITSSLSRYFGETDTTHGWESFFSLFADFMSNFSTAQEELQAAEAKKIEDARKRTAAADLKAKIDERRTSSASRRTSFGGTPRTPSGFSDACSFDFGHDSGMEISQDRRHTICTILSGESHAAFHTPPGLDLASPLSRRLSPRRPVKLTSVQEEAHPLSRAVHLSSPIGQTAAPLTPSRPILGDILNSPTRLLSPTHGHKRAASTVTTTTIDKLTGSPRATGLLTSPAKHHRRNSSVRVGQEN